MSDFEKSINASDLIDWIMCAFPDWCVGDVRAIVDHVNEMPSAQSKETCDTCKYGYFGDGMCDYCRVRYPSHYERRTDERQT